ANSSIERGRAMPASNGLSTQENSSGAGMKRPEVRIQRSEVSDQKTGVRSQESGIRGQKSSVYDAQSANRRHAAAFGRVSAAGYSPAPTASDRFAETRADCRS